MLRSRAAISCLCISGQMTCTLAPASTVEQTGNHKVAEFVDEDDQSEDSNKNH